MTKISCGYSTDSIVVVENFAVESSPENFKNVIYTICLHEYRPEFIGMHIAVLYEDYTGSEHYLNSLEPPRNVEKYDDTKAHIYHHVPLKKSDGVKRVKDLILSRKYDLFINLCEDLDDGNGCGLAIVELLDKMNVAYTGADPKFYAVSKTAMKMAAVSSDVRIPDYVTVESLEELTEDRIARLGMPLIVKHATGHDSLGMTNENLVTNRQQLFKQVERMVNEFGPSATIEQFIDGPEFTVLVAENPDDENEPVVFQPVQCFFTNGQTFKHFDLKWTDYNSVKYGPVDDREVARDLIEASKRIFSTCYGNGYARCDFRMDSKTGVIYFLEINTNPTVFYEGDFSTADNILNIDHAGFGGFIKLIISAALKRREKTMPKIKIEYDPKREFHVVAARDIALGEKIYSEEVATLTSTKFVREHWTEKLDPTKNTWFRKYAFLIGENIYRKWHDDPDQWLPINHSCDPNAWICYDVFIHARKFIKKGDEITIDYGTFDINDEGDNRFECHCGSLDCRRIIRPSEDYKSKNFRQKYAGHLTSYVESLIEKTD